MFINRFLINNFRNIDYLDIEPCSGFNFICGANGSGKTSVLEAIYYLSLARSFRTNAYQYLIKQGTSGFNLFANVGSELLKNTTDPTLSSDNSFKELPEQADQASYYVNDPAPSITPDYVQIEGDDQLLDHPISSFNTTIGISRNKGSDLMIKINSNPIHRLMDLIEHTCVQLIHPQGVDLITNDAEGRRSFIDWGVYYSDPEFKDLWFKYRKILKQRNTLLRKEAYRLGSNQDQSIMLDPSEQQWQMAELTMWDESLAFLSEKITEKRLHYLEQLQLLLGDFIGQFLPNFKLKFELYYGWEKSSDLRSIMANNLEKERGLGYTMYGCHRADLKIKNNTISAGATLSRGQLKMLVYAMRLAQGLLLKNQTERSCIYLIDDLNSELDSNSQTVLLNTLVKCKNQVFISNIKQDLLIPKERSDYKVFYLDRGGLANSYTA